MKQLKYRSVKGSVTKFSSKCWNRKKCVGQPDGLSTPLKKIYTPLFEQEQPAFQMTAERSTEAQKSKRKHAPTARKLEKVRLDILRQRETLRRVTIGIQVRGRTNALSNHFVTNGIAE
ncbi:hypothetical protein NPIL_573371 [Nephila pilipes]|uniref:Uncharacterized protein n=1 Tax=Nephila pilipes TaxID=299642 RepID=A0A8X6PA12_NEPPI|nr:hypothetical protein NPIL_573371 [Nephila pilipes]